MSGLLLAMLACDQDPCAWAYGSWQQSAVVYQGAELPPPEFEASLALTPDGFGYRPERGAEPEPAMLNPVDPDCETLSVESGTRRYTLRLDGQDLLLQSEPDRVFRFERGEP